MIKIVIGNDNCLITEEQCKWFKTLEHALEYTLTAKLIEIPNVIADQSIDITQFQQLVECYQTQITSNVIDYKRPRSTLEHYLDGILDDIDEHNREILDFILECDEHHRIVIDMQLYQLVSNYCAVIYNPNHAYITWIDSLECRVIRLGSLEIFIHLFSYLDCTDICALASSYGQLDCLKYAYQHGCPWDTRTCEFSAGNGHLNCLQYAHDNKCPWDSATCGYAAQFGHLECLKYLHKNGCPWDKLACSYASLNGNLDCLQYLHHNTCPWDSWACSNAAAHGHLECLQYLHKNGCPWDKQTCINAASGIGELDCLQYAHENGCPFNPDEISKCLGKIDNTDIIEYVTHVMCRK